MRTGKPRNKSESRRRRRIGRLGSAPPVKMKRRRYRHDRSQLWAPDEALRVSTRHQQQPGGDTQETNQVSSGIVISLLFVVLVHSPLLGVQIRQAAAMTSALTYYDGATFYKALVGSRIRIACNASRWQDDSVSTVLWFKSSTNLASTSSQQQQPIYTLDARQRPLSSGSARHLVADSWRGRAKFVIPSMVKMDNAHRVAESSLNESASGAQLQQPQVPYLEVSALEAEDQGEYRCRVDYRSRPRENFLIVLFVLVPPSRVEIMDSSGRSLEQIYGPLSEGSDLTLLCLAKGGRPAPAVHWLQRHDEQQRIIDDTYLTLSDFVTLRAASSPNANWSTSAWPADDNDKNQRQQAINFSAGNASAKQKLDSPIGAESLVAEWHAWPEYDYFYSQLGDKLPSKFRANEINNGNGLSPVGKRVAESNQWSAQQQQQQQQQRQLLDLQADETITTSVNVLHLVELSREHLAGASAASVAPAEHASQAASAAARARAPNAGLECHASNLHYDLRSLIKLFAPPSLVESAAKDQMPFLSPSTGAVASRQLVEAIERSLAANLWPATQAGPLQATSALQDLQRQLERESTTGGAQPLKQIKLDGDVRATSASVDVAAGPSQAQMQERQQHQGGDASVRAQPNSPDWPTVIYQQIARPHQLSELANADNQVLAETSRSNAASRQHEPAGLARSKLIALDAYLRPLEVKILGTQRPLTAAQVHEFTCTSSGSRPAAKIVWLKNGRPLVQDSPAASASTTQTNSTWTTQTSADGKQQRSKLALRLERADNRAQLSCRASNDKALALLESSTTVAKERQLSLWQLEDTITLSVQYAPIARLELGNKMLSERLREGNDIYFECQIDAQPQVREVTWLHNERPINETGWWQSASDQQQQQLRPTSRLIVSNNSLVLQRVRADQSGQYACMASNSEGIGVSNRIELRVLHAPICAGGRVVPVGAYDAAGLPKGAHEMDNSNEADEKARTKTSTSDNNDNKKRHQQRRHQASSAALANNVQPSGADEPVAALRLTGGRVAVGTHLEFRCEWLAEPAERIEFAWYLNNSASERRILSASLPNSQLSSATSRETTITTTTTTSTSREQQTVSKLSVRLESAGDFGQLFCLAKNELGQQKRACVFNIEQDDQISPKSIAACLPLNVTSDSAWIGCEIDGATTSGQRYQFDVLVYRYNGDDASNSALDSDSLNVRNLKLNRQTGAIGGVASPAAAWHSQGRRLEANLSSNLLDEPLFALANLRPLTNYALEIYPLDLLTNSRLQQPPAVVRLSTLAGHVQSGQMRAAVDQPATSTGGAGDESADSSGPSIRRITEPHRPDLLAAALISTRSTNGRTFGGDFSRSLLRQQKAADTSSQSGWWSSLIRGLFGEQDAKSGQWLPAAPHTNKQRARYEQPAQMLDWTNTTLSFSLVLLVTLAALLLLRRFASSGARARHLRANKLQRGRKTRAATETTNKHSRSRSSSSLPPSDSCYLDDDNDDDSGEFKSSSFERASSGAAEKPQQASGGGQRLDLSSADESTRTVEVMMLMGQSSCQRPIGSNAAPSPFVSCEQQQQQAHERSASVVLSAAPLLVPGHHQLKGPLIYSGQQLGAQAQNCSLGSSSSLLANPQSSLRANGSSSSAFGTMRLVHRPQQQRHATNHNDRLPALPCDGKARDGPAQRGQQQQTSTVTRSRSSLCFDSGSLQLEASDLAAAAAAATPSFATSQAPLRLTHSSGGNAQRELHADAGEQQQHYHHHHQQLISDANFVLACEQAAATTDGAHGLGDEQLFFNQLNNSKSELSDGRQQGRLRRANESGCRCVLATTTSPTNKVQHANKHLGACSNNRSIAQTNLHSLMSSTATTTITSDESNSGIGLHLNGASRNCADLVATRAPDTVDFIELLPASSTIIEHNHNYPLEVGSLGHNFVISDYETGSCQQHQLVSSLGIDSPSNMDLIISSSSPALSLSPAQQVIYRHQQLMFSDMSGCESLTPVNDTCAGATETRRDKQPTSILKNSSNCSNSSGIPMIREGKIHKNAKSRREEHRVNDNKRQETDGTQEYTSTNL